MPRTPRLDHPGALHHITARGIERRRVFVDDVDRRRFLRTAVRVFSESKTICLAWALMTNHVHFLLRTGDVPISRVMHRLLTSHAVAFNRRHERVGHLFQNRFHSRLVDGDDDLATCVRYVHLNPVEAGIVHGARALERHPWTGHGELMGTTCVRLVDVGCVLTQFADDIASARRSLREFMARGTDEVASPNRIGTVVPLSRRAQGEARAFGVQSVLARTRAIADATAALDSATARHAAARAMGWSVENVVVHVCRRLAVERDEVVAGGRSAGAVEARACAAYLACEFLGATQAEAARRLGVSQQAIASCIRRGRDASGVPLVDLMRQTPD